MKPVTLSPIPVTRKSLIYKGNDKGDKGDKKIKEKGGR